MSSSQPPDADRPPSEPARDVAEEEYFQRVERHFGLRRGGPLMLSPRDWKLIRSWHDDGVPLPVVLRGINRAFDRFGASGPRVDRINSLRYCRQHVAEEWRRHRELAAAEGTAARAGADIPFRDALEHLSRAARACRRAAVDERLPEAATEALNAAADDLDGLTADVEDGGVGTHELDARAGEIEATMTGRLRDLTVEYQVSRDADARTADRARLGDVADVRERLHLPPFSPYGL